MTSSSLVNTGIVILDVNFAANSGYLSSRAFISCFSSSRITTMSSVRNSIARFSLSTVSAASSPAPSMMRNPPAIFLTMAAASFWLKSLAMILADLTAVILRSLQTARTRLSASFVFPDPLRPTIRTLPDFDVRSPELLWMSAIASDTCSPIPGIEEKYVNSFLSVSSKVLGTISMRSIISGSSSR